MPGSTPLLLSNTLLRAMGAVIDTSQKVIHATKVSKTIPIQLTEKGLFLLDLNDLVDTKVSQQAAETHQVSEVPKVCHQLDVNAPSNVPHDKTSDSSPHTCHTHNQHEDAKDANPQGITNLTATEHQQCTDQMHSVDLRCSNHAQFAKSFQIPTKVRHVHFEHASESSPRARRDVDVQFRPHELEATGGQCARLRTGPFGSEVSDSMGTPSRLGDVVHQQVREVGQGKSPTLPPLCATQDRAGRTRAHEHPSECRAEDIRREAEDEAQGGAPPDLSSPSGKHAQHGRGRALRATAGGGGDVPSLPSRSLGNKFNTWRPRCCTWKMP